MPNRTSAASTRTHTQSRAQLPERIEGEGGAPGGAPRRSLKGAAGARRVCTYGGSGVTTRTCSEGGNARTLGGVGGATDGDHTLGGVDDTTGGDRTLGGIDGARGGDRTQGGGDGAVCCCCNGCGDRGTDGVGQRRRGVKLGRMHVKPEGDDDARVAKCP